MMDCKTFNEAKSRLFEKYFSFLNEQQRAAVCHVTGPLLVLAGAGSGKTTVLVNRIANIISFGTACETELYPADADELYDQMCALLEHGTRAQIGELLARLAVRPAAPYRVLCITFTNKAANEFKERLRTLLGERADDIWAGTFHSICVRILRRYIHLLGYDNHFAIYDAEDSKKLITDILKRLNISESILAPKAAQNAISRAKERGELPEDVAETAGRDIRLAKINEVYTQYQRALKTASALDFDDIILLTNRLFEREPEVAQHYRDQFDYILVDEYQDTNPSQSKLVCALAEGKRNVCVVGDDDQSIYAFRGATVENILGFDRVFSDACTIRLEQNYRSTGNILAAANEIIQNNTGRKGKNLWTDRGDGARIQVKRQYTQSDEASFIVGLIKERVAEGDFHYSDFAVLYRVNALANALELVFAKSRIPYRVFGGIRFYERKEIKDILAYLSVVNNPADSTRLGRIINVPKRAIGQTTMETLARLSEETGKSMFDILCAAADYPALAKAAPKLERFGALIHDLRDYAAEHTLPEIVNHVIEESGYRQMLTAEEETDRENNILELVSSAEAYAETAEDPSLPAFLEELALVSDTDSYDSAEDSVALMTVHSAKGLEFPVVFIIGFEEGLFPSLQALTEGDRALEEERRLAYVAVTRAKQELYLLHTGTRLLYGRTEQRPISRFASEIPDHLKEVQQQKPALSINDGSVRRRRVDSQESFLRNVSSASAPAAATAVAERFEPGSRVAHPLFGEGEILSAENMGGDILYEIEFSGGAKKRLMGSFAKLRGI